MASTPVVTERVFKWWDYPIFILLSSLSLWAIFYFFLCWYSFDDWRAHPVSYSLLTAIMLVIVINNQGRWFLLPYMRTPKPVIARPGWKVAVVTTFVPSAEPIEMLDETVKALIALDYPHDTWVLDEGDDDKVKALCVRLGAQHFSRNNLPQYQTAAGLFQSGSKHGNYNAWLHEIGFEGYDIITTFDPDHVPESSFLSHVLGYFEDAEVAYVQTAQAYYNQGASFIARGAAEETYAYYSSVQMAGYGIGYPIIVGCHNTQRVAALKQVGGFPAHDAEDLLLTLSYQAFGWKGVYLPQILARGLTPVDWSGYLRQQRRWARSVLDIKFRLYPKLAKNLSLKSRVISFLHGLNYLQRSVMIFLSILLMSSMLLTGTAPTVLSHVTFRELGILLLVLQACEFYRQCFYLNRRNEWGFHWRAALLHYAKWPWFILAFVDVLSGKPKPYVTTPKMKLESKNHLLLLPNVMIVILLCSAWIAGHSLGASLHPVVHIFSAIYVIASIILIWTDFSAFPAPYNKELGIGLALKKAPGLAAQQGKFLPKTEGPVPDKVQPHAFNDLRIFSHTPIGPIGKNGREILEYPQRQVTVRDEERKDKER